MTTPDLSVVFPVFNEEENVPILLEEIDVALRGQPWSYEMVAVDDGSTDRSFEILQQSRAKYPNLRVISFVKNSGQTAALDAGWRGARGTYVVSLDADLQNDPADIPPMMRARQSAGHAAEADSISHRQRRAQLDHRRSHHRYRMLIKASQTRSDRSSCALHRHAPFSADAHSHARIQSRGDARESPTAKIWRLEIRCNESRGARTGRLFRGSLDVQAHFELQGETRVVTFDQLWLAFGLLGQLIFGARFVVQWIASERKQESHIPIVFWYLSIVGGIITTAYAIHKRDAVFIIGQGAGLVVYVRNLMLIYRAQRRTATTAPEARANLD